MPSLYWTSPVLFSYLILFIILWKLSDVYNSTVLGDTFIGLVELSYGENAWEISSTDGTSDFCDYLFEWNALENLQMFSNLECNCLIHWKSEEVNNHFLVGWILVLYLL